MSRKIYPKKVGTCLHCKGDIIAKNSGFNKPNRKFCSKSCRMIVQNKQAVWTSERRQKLALAASKVHRGRVFSDIHRRNLSQALQGQSNWNWKGGISPENNRIRSSIEYKEWRRAVFQRDDYRCFDCGERGGNLEADHIYPFALYPRLRFQLENGRTLCVNCHKRTPTYGRKTKVAINS
jgi:hypothetical protein